MKQPVYSRRALADLREIFAYIATENVVAAERLDDEIRRAVLRLAANPYLGHRRPSLTSAPVRFWTVRGTYLIVYQVGPSGVAIVRIIHGAREVSSLGL